MPLLIATNTLRLGRRRNSSPNTVSEQYNDNHKNNDGMHKNNEYGMRTADVLR